MPKRARWALRASTALLFLSGYLALASVQGFGSALLLAALAVLALSPLGERLDRESPGYRMVTKAISISYACFIPVSVALLGLVPALIALIAFIQFYTMLHHKEEKNYYHVYLMSFFLLLAACNQAPEASIGLVLALFLGATIWAFFSLRVAFEAETSQSHVPADIVRFGEEPLRQPHDDRDPFDAGIVGYVFLMGVAALFITAAIFFLTPRVEAGLLGRSNAPISVTGVPQSVALQSGRTIQEDFTPVMRAAFPEEPGGRTGVAPLYWRITTLAKFDGAGWVRAKLSDTGEPGIDGAVTMPWRRNDDVQRNQRRGAKLVHQYIYMDSVPPNGMPALDLVQRIALSVEQRGVNVDWADGNDLTVLLNSNGPRQMHYDAWSEVDEPAPEALRAATGDYELEEDDFALLTEQRLLPETLAVVENVTREAQTNYDKVLAIQSYLSSNAFVYSLTVPPLPPEFAIDAFINTVRTGHCELYATALAQMVRALGIPARVVMGYKGGEYNEGDGGYVVRQSMAHLWAEVLFPGHGWVKFDPSPQSDGSDNPSLFARMRMSASLYALRARMLWFSEVVGYQGFRAMSLESLRYRIFGEIRQLQAKAGDVAVSGQSLRYVAGATIGVCALIALMWVIYLKYNDNISLQRSTVGRYVLSREQKQAIKVYRRLRKRLRSAGVEVAQKTAEELLASVAHADWPDKAEAERLLHAYNEVRFGGRPLPGERLKQLLRTLRGLRLRRGATV